MSEKICPACGAAIQFKSRFSTITICQFCQNVLGRESNHLHYSGKIAAVAEDLSFFQIGTRGQFNNNRFEIIGHLKVNWEQGHWNEWYVLEDSGVVAWICEAMGFLYYSYQHTITRKLLSPNQYQIGDCLELANNNFIISDIKSFNCPSAQGELPIEFQPGLFGVSIDLKDAQQNCAYLEFINQEYRFFLGRHVEFEALNLENMREIDGW